MMFNESGVKRKTVNSGIFPFIVTFELSMTKIGHIIEQQTKQQRNRTEQKNRTEQQQN